MTEHSTLRKRRVVGLAVGTDVYEIHDYRVSETYKYNVTKNGKLISQETTLKAAEQTVLDFIKFSEMEAY